MMERREELQKQTIMMQQYLKQIEDLFTQTKTTGYEADFSTEMRPFIDKIHNFTNKWHEQAREWVLKVKPRHLYPQQIDACAENMKQISVEAFYSTTDSRRFKQYCNSVHYILEKLLTKLEMDCTDKARN